MEIETRYDQERGCGWREPGGLYLVCGALAEECGRLPLILAACPACGQGVKPSRGWTWVDPRVLAGGSPCHLPGRCRTCPLGGGVRRAGLLWVGGQFYATPGEFVAEAGRLGLSRRIAAIPRGFCVGETWVLLAHRQVVAGPDGARQPAIFAAFRPEAIEYVVKADDPPAKLKALAGRGVTLVRIERTAGPADEAAMPLFAGEGQGG